MTGPYCPPQSPKGPPSEAVPVSEAVLAGRGLQVTHSIPAQRWSRQSPPQAPQSMPFPLLVPRSRRSALCSQPPSLWSRVDVAAKPPSLTWNAHAISESNSPWLPINPRINLDFPWLRGGQHGLRPPLRPILASVPWLCSALAAAHSSPPQVGAMEAAWRDLLPPLGLTVPLNPGVPTCRSWTPHGSHVPLKEARAPSSCLPAS